MSDRSGALVRARSFTRAALQQGVMTTTTTQQQSFWSTTTMSPRAVDLPFDGSPNLTVVHSKADNCPLQVYNWPAYRTLQDQKSCHPPRGIVFLLHGVRAHLRLTWLAKRPPHLADRPTPLSSIPSEYLVSRATPSSPKSPSSEETRCDDLDETSVHRSPKPILSMLDERLSMASISDLLSFSEESAAAPRSRRFSEATEEEKECQVFYEGSWIEALNGAGYEVFGMDLRGHGRSGGDRCSVSDFELYCTDVITVIEEVIWGGECHRTIDRMEDQDQSQSKEGGREGGRISGHPKLFVIGVSLSTLILCKVLQKPSAKNLHIHACALFSGFLKEGARYSTRPIKTLLKLLVRIRHFMPNLPLILPQKPETRGPSWQIRYGDVDPYLCKRPFTVRMVGTCVAALQEFDDTKDEFVNARACEHIKMFHNYYDMVNPVDGSLEVYSWLMEHCRDQDLQCTIFNSQEVDSKEANQWHPKVEFDRSPIDLGHTLITDTDNLYVFEHFFKWLINI